MKICEMELWNYIKERVKQFLLHFVYHKPVKLKCDIFYTRFGMNYTQNSIPPQCAAQSVGTANQMFTSLIQTIAVSSRDVTRRLRKNSNRRRHVFCGVERNFQTNFWSFDRIIFFQSMFIYQFRKFIFNFPWSKDWKVSSLTSSLLMVDRLGVSLHHDWVKTRNGKICYWKQETIRRPNLKYTLFDCRWNHFNLIDFSNGIHWQIQALFKSNLIANQNWHAKQPWMRRVNMWEEKCWVEHCHWMVWSTREPGKRTTIDGLQWVILAGIMTAFCHTLKNPKEINISRLCSIEMVNIIMAVVWWKLTFLVQTVWMRIGKFSSMAAERENPIIDDINLDKNLEYLNMQATYADGRRQSAAREFLIPAKNRKNLHVIKNAFAR